MKISNEKWTMIGPLLKFGYNRTKGVRDDWKTNEFQYYIMFIIILCYIIFILFYVRLWMMVEKPIILLLFINGFVSWTSVLFFIFVYKHNSVLDLTNWFSLDTRARSCAI